MYSLHLNFLLIFTKTLGLFLFSSAVFSSPEQVLFLYWFSSPDQIFPLNIRISFNFAQDIYIIFMYSIFFFPTLTYSFDRRLILYSILLFFLFTTLSIYSFTVNYITPVHHLVIQIIIGIPVIPHIYN